MKSQTEDQRLVGIEEKIVYDEGKVTTRKRTRRTHVYQHIHKNVNGPCMHADKQANIPSQSNTFINLFECPHMSIFVDFSA